MNPATQTVDAFRRSSDRRPYPVAELIAARDLLHECVEVLACDNIRPRTREVIARAIVGKLDAVIAAWPA